MDSSLTLYFEHLELMAFFSGYPLIYFLILSFAGNKSKRSLFKNQTVSLLPFAYALVGVLYWGLQIKNLFPDYSFAHIKTEFQYPLLKIWGLLSIFFFLPLLRKKPVFSLLHSLIFFSLLIRDIYLQLLSGSVFKYDLKNDMKVYSDSLLLNVLAVAGVGFIYLLILRFRKNKNTSQAS